MRGLSGFAKGCTASRGFVGLYRIEHDLIDVREWLDAYDHSDAHDELKRQRLYWSYDVNWLALYVALYQVQFPGYSQVVAHRFSCLER